jgi:3-dehydroquinate dehydratase II
MKPIFVLNGPNLNLLGDREPEVYGRTTLMSLEAGLMQEAKDGGAAIVFRQTNHEGILVDWVQEARLEASALILNAGAYTHTSVALHDALKTLSIPIIEVHLSNVFKREPFRQHSYISPLAAGVICGFGAKSYSLALLAALSLLGQSADEPTSSRAQHSGDNHV